MDDLISRCHIDDDVSDDIDKLALRLLAKVNACKLHEPLQVPLYINLGQSSEHELKTALHFLIKETLDVYVRFSLLVTTLL